MQNLELAVAKRLKIYRMKGLSHTDALNKFLNKLVKKRFSQGYSSPNAATYDHELVAKLRKVSGMSHEETVKTLQLKKELDYLLENRLHQTDSNGCSSEDSLSGVGNFGCGGGGGESMMMVNNETAMK